MTGKRVSLGWVAWPARAAGARQSAGSGYATFVSYSRCTASRYAFRASGATGSNPLFSCCQLDYPLDYPLDYGVGGLRLHMMYV